VRKGEEAAYDEEKEKDRGGQVKAGRESDIEVHNSSSRSNEVVVSLRTLATALRDNATHKYLTSSHIIFPDSRSPSLSLSLFLSPSPLPLSAIPFVAWRLSARTCAARVRTKRQRQPPPPAAPTPTARTMPAPQPTLVGMGCAKLCESHTEISIISWLPLRFAEIGRPDKRSVFVTREAPLPRGHFHKYNRPFRSKRLVLPHDYISLLTTNRGLRTPISK
jgi:hypothetical protein